MRFDAAEMLSGLFAGTTAEPAADPVPVVLPAEPPDPPEATDDPGESDAPDGSLGRPPFDPLPADKPLEEYNEWCWRNIDPTDYAFLTGPRRFPAPCPWCGGRTRHNPLCAEMLASWEPVLPFGKYKGRHIDETPLDYLAWLAGTKTNLTADLRHVIEMRLAKYRHN